MNAQKAMIIRRSMAFIIVILAIWAIIILAIYGIVQLRGRSDRILQKQICINTINQQQQEINRLKNEIRK